MAHVAVLYTKDGCHLCERAREVLHRLESDFELEVKEVDITTSSDLYERYRYEIPVVVIDGRHQFEANKIAEHYLRKALSNAGAKWPWRR